jgi:urease beta subunit
MIPGEVMVKNSEILCNAGKKTMRLSVVNASDRAIQVGSHFHFFEVNRGLVFDRQKTFGMRLNIPSGMGLRFEPGERKEVELLEIGGQKVVYGLNNLTCGSVNDPNIKEKALGNAAEAGFMKEDGQL